MKHLFKKILTIIICIFAFTGCTEPNGSSSNPKASEGGVQVSKIEVSKEPDKVAYYIDEVFDATGGEVTITYTDQTDEVSPLTDSKFVIDPVNTTSAGQKTVIVKYSGKQDTFRITVSIEQIDVIFNYNYSGAPTPTTVKTNKNSPITKPTDPTRSEYTFEGWYTDVICTSAYNFALNVVSSFTLYANWLEEGTYYNANFSYNYYGCNPDSFTLKVKENLTVARPSISPTRVGYAFVDWYGDIEGTTLYNFSSTFTGDKTIYAKWNRTSSGIVNYLFEAEGTSLNGKAGPGYSGYCGGTDMIVFDDHVGASNNRFVSYLYASGSSLEWYIASDIAVSDLTFVARLSAEFGNMTFTPDNYVIILNGNELNYGTIAITDVPGGGAKEFADFTIGTSLTLVKGLNKIEFITDNDDNPLGAGAGTMQATAPIIDCIKLSTTAVLIWDDNYPSTSLIYS
ncbi:MAG: InlB B-repeat-containing protein [Bacillales bacterium]|nr:InlB B-repeat-containing protein [Bacillales bacterium]